MNNNLHKYECSIHLVEYGKNDFEYEGYVNLLPNVVGSGKTYEEALNEIYSNLEAYLQYCNEKSINYPNPEDINPSFNLSGRLTIRLPKNLHYSLNTYAKKDGMSLNSIVIDAIREYITTKDLEKKFVDVFNSFSKQLQTNKNINLFTKNKQIKKQK